MTHLFAIGLVELGEKADLDLKAYVKNRHAYVMISSPWVMQENKVGENKQPCKTSRVLTHL